MTGDLVFNMKFSSKKLYVWSVVLEPMLFFVIIHQTVLGFSGNVSRLLQFIFIVVFLMEGIIKRKNTIFISFLDYRYRYFYLYFVLSVTALFLSIISYYVFIDVSVTEKYVDLIKGSAFRIIFEYVIFIYYVFYFAYLPTVILKRREDVLYFFKVFFLAFNLSILVGIIDFYLSYAGHGVISRHLHEYIGGGPTLVGVRFHGLAGEPRDAFVLLGLGLGLYFAKSIFFNSVVRISYCSLIVICMLLTFSTSGIVGMLIFIALFICTRSIQNIKRSLIYLLLLPIFFMLGYTYIVESPRLMLHAQSLLSILSIYKTGDVPLALSGQMSNIFPIFWIVENILKYNLVPLFFGGGFGVSSQINNLMGTWNGIGTNNPHANIIRVISETGIVGLYIYVCSFYKPMSLLSYRILNKIHAFNLVTCTLFILAISLGHRSSVIFIFTGIVYACFNVLKEMHAESQFTKTIS